jgi:DNA-binding NarL/FixJ family response regulator
MQTTNVTASRPPLVLLVDPVVTSRHWMWRSLSRAFGVIEAPDAKGARDWIAQRPDIDALIVQDELPDARGVELVRDLAEASHPIASHAIVLARPNADASMLAVAGAAVIERGDLRTLLAKLAAWFFPGSRIR